MNSEKNKIKRKTKKRKLYLKYEIVIFSELLSLNVYSCTFTGTPYLPAAATAVLYKQRNMIRSSVVYVFFSSLFEFIDIRAVSNYHMHHANRL